MIHGKIDQIATDGSSPAFLNIDAQMDSIAVWGSSYMRPTVLVQWGINFRLIQFESTDDAQRWVAINASDAEVLWLGREERGKE